ncbi:MAG: hypothetical protein EPO22_01140 [Dehalococcoidia bacterium]|nr:MAG: hypothetical protein EPO22_01140 [Dehalococcoidia bacterium]
MAVRGGGAAHAQYPQPSGSVAVTAAATNVTVGGSVAITATVRDANGDVLANESCTLAIASQPGTGASVSPTSAETDANGVVEATVDVGSTTGFVVVRVTCGDIAGSVTVVASAAVAPAATVPALGQAPASGIELPSTGGGSDAGSSGFGMRIGAGAAIVLLLVGAQAARTYRRRRA